MPPEKNHFYEFGDFRLDVSQKTLLRDGQPVSLTPKVFDTLQVLVESAGSLLEKDELMKKIWHDRFVEEGNLVFNVKMLRKALGDSATEPRFIETVPRRGYRFIAEVAENPIVGERNFSPVLPENTKTLRPTTPPRKSFLPIAALAVLLFAAGSLFLGKSFFNSEPNAPILSAAFRAEKFSTTGKVAHAAISPDGKLAAYADESNGKHSLWLRKLETSESVQLVSPSAEFYSEIEFTNDGDTLFFVRALPNANATFAAYRLSINGGVPEKVLDGTQVWLSLSPDDKKISFVRCGYRTDDFCSLFVADAADGKNERKILTRPAPFHILDNRFSPDGKSIAFAVGQSWNGGSDFRLMRVDLETGAENEMTAHRFFNIKNLQWLPEANGLLFTAKEVLDGKLKIWQVSAETGETQPLTNDAANYSDISLNKAGDKLVATQVSSDFRMYVSENGETKYLTAAREAIFTSDGKIVYSSDDGNIWTISSDGGNQRQLTNNPANDFSPRVSPDNRYIFFASNRTGANQIWRMNADGSDQIQITENEGGYPRFVSPDGRWVYYESGLRQTLWRTSADGGAEREMQISEEKLYSPAFSSDGKFVAYFFRAPEIKIGVMDLADRKRIKVLDYGDGKSDGIKIAWSADNRTLNFVVSKTAKNFLWQQSLDENEPRLVADLGDQQVEDFNLAPNDKKIVVIRGEWLHDAVLIAGLK